jgi:hypothetical protein
VYISFDDGAHWEPLQLNLPRSSVRDLHIHGNDLIAATHGRGFWVLDDISMLRQLADSVTNRDSYFFQPSPAIRWQSGGGSSLTAGQNPRGGAVLDYYLKRAPATPITLEIRDAANAVIRKYSSEAPPTDTLKTATDSLAHTTREAMRDSLAYEPADSVMSARAGTNRFVWNLRYPGAKALKNTLIDEGTIDGPVAPPGDYTARLIVGKDTLVRRFAVVADPRVKSTTDELARQFALALRVRNRITEITEAAQRVEDLQSQLDQRMSQTKDEAYAKRVEDAAKPLRAKLEAVRAELYEVGCHADQCSLDQPMKLYNQFLTMNAQVQSGDYEPTKQHGEMFTSFSDKLAVQLRTLQNLENGDLSALNRLLAELQLPAVWVAPRKNAVVP